MHRIPVEEFNPPKYVDNDVLNAWKWFMSFISESEWARRKAVIESKITVRFRNTPPSSENLTDGTLLVIKDDVIGWYLYLIDMLFNEKHKYEHFQGARIVPIFKRFGMDLEKLKNINGIEKRIKSLLRKRKSEADAILFEMLTALLWARNGYQITFLEEENEKKTPDILATKEDKTWNIECKRQSKTSDYTYRETAKRQKMISYISNILIQKNIILEIVFHVELEKLPDNYLLELLEHKLKEPIKGKIVSNAQVDIDLSFVDIPEVKEFVNKRYVKHNSPILNFLIGKKAIDNKSFTCGINANYYRVGDGEINNLFVNDIKNAFAVYWICDAKEALLAKARDIRNQVNDAIKQFSSDVPAVVHIGMETFDGPAVEKVRFEKIQGTIGSINPMDTNLRWIFCHFFQSYSPPDQTWAFDESVTQHTSYVAPNSPITIKTMIVDDTDTEDDISHWDRPLP